MDKGKKFKEFWNRLWTTLYHIDWIIGLSSTKWTQFLPKLQNEKVSRFCEFVGHNFKLWSSLPEAMWDKLSKFFVTISNNIHYFLVFFRGQIVYVQYSNHPELKTEPSQHSVGVSILGHYLLKMFFCNFFTIFEC